MGKLGDFNMTTLNSLTVREILKLMHEGVGELGSNSDGKPVIRIYEVQPVAERYLRNMISDGLIRLDIRGRWQITERGRAVATRRIE